MAYNDEITAQPGWREITHDDVTKGMRVRVVTTRGDRMGKLPAGARFQVITTYQMGDTWVPEGDPTYRLVSLPEQPEPDPALVDLIGEENARKVAAAGLVCEPRARQ